jgi:hypothetical protein
MEHITAFCEAITELATTEPLCACSAHPIAMSPRIIESDTIQACPLINILISGPGVPLALGSAVLFGVSAPLSKLLLGTMEPQLLAGLLYLGALGGKLELSMDEVQVEQNSYLAECPFCISSGIP